MCADWLRKYEFLTTKPSFGEGRQISLKTLPKLNAHLEKLLSREEQEKRKREAKAKAATAATKGDVADPEDVEAASSAAQQLGDPKKQGTTQGLHELAAALVGRGNLELARGLFKQQFCSVDVLPELASRGMLVEITAVRDLLLREQAPRDP